MAGVGERPTPVKAGPEGCSERGFRSPSERLRADGAAKIIVPSSAGTALTLRDRFRPLRESSTPGVVAARQATNPDEPRSASAIERGQSMVAACTIDYP
jgi:hypothetical protein